MSHPSPAQRESAARRDRALELLREHLGSTTREMAGYLCCDVGQANGALHVQMRAGLVISRRVRLAKLTTTYRWWLVGDPSIPEGLAPVVPPRPVEADRGDVRAWTPEAPHPGILPSGKCRYISERRSPNLTCTGGGIWPACLFHLACWGDERIR